MKNTYPITFPRAKGIQLTVNGAAEEVLATNVAYFVPAVYTGEAKVEITLEKPAGAVDICPKRLGVVPKVEGNKVTLTLSGNCGLYITMDGLDLPLIFYGSKPEEYDGKATYYFKGGQTYEMGEIVLKSNESIYIERGAVVKGSISALSADNIKIYGQGILDVSYFKFFKSGRRSVYLTDCNQVEIKDIIIVEPTTWMVVLAGCTNVHVDGIKEIGEVVSSDGIDVVGSNQVLIENCFLRNNDDCVVIKHKNLERKPEFEQYLKPVYGVEVKNCVFFDSGAGNAIEIGHELVCEEIRDVHFHDIDIIRVDGQGAAFSIHAGDCATVRDIVYENIFVDHYYDKLVDIRVMKSQFNHSEERGQIRNIKFKNIRVRKIAPNYGYSVSVIGGFDSEHTVDGVSFEEFYLNDTKVTNAHMLDLFTREAYHITFE